ncbi:MAG: TonB-dependent receptor [Novosphingobium sp.]
MALITVAIDCGFHMVARRALLAGVACSALAAAPAALAQEAAEEPINEIVVTATKREQTLQDVPVAVSVTSAQTLQRAQIRDIKDLATLVPSLRVNQLQSSANTNFFIRGFGNGANNAGVEPSVGLFVDGVYRSRSASMIDDLPDVQRVEVLRGPQSTLFGKNASAGIISFVTREPQFEFGGNVEATYGNYEAMVFKGSVTGPVSDTIALSLAGGINKRDGYVKNVVDGRRFNERDRWFVRGQALFRPSNDLKVRIIGDYARIDENCCAVVNLQPSAATAALMHPLVGGMVNTPAQRWDGITYANLPSSNRIKNYGASGQVDYDFGAMKLTSITALRKSRAINNQDSDFTSADLLSRNYQDVRIRTFTQELRLASDFDGPLNFLVGGFYMNEKVKQANQLYLGEDFRNYADLLIRGASGGAFNVGQVEALLGAAGGNPGAFIGKFFGNGTGLTEAYRLKDDSYSIFGQVDYEITDRLTLTAGINYTHDKKRYATNVTSNEAFSNVQLSDYVAPVTNLLISQAVGGILGVPGGFASPAQIAGFAAAQPGVFSVVQSRSAAGASGLVSLRALQFLPPFLNVPNAVEDGRLSDGDLSYTLRLAYEVNDAISVYASYATGYKAASVNLSRDSRPFPRDAAAITAAGIAVPNQTYSSRYANPEDATVYEAGIKAKWGIASANLAVFKQSIKGFQSNVFSGTGFVLTNAGKQSTFGIEFEGMVKPVPQLTLSLAMTYLDPRYDSFVISAFGDLSGRTPAGVPPISTTMGFEWDQPIGEDHLILRGDYHYESAFQPVEGLPGFLVRNPVTGVIDPASVDVALAMGRRFKREVNEINASITYAMAMGLELSVWGRNLSNDRYVMQVFDSPAQSGSISGYPNQPRTYGVTARYKF